MGANPCSSTNCCCVPWRRFWLVWSYHNADGRRRQEPLLAWARQFSTQRNTYFGPGGAAVLFERDPSKPLPPERAPVPHTQHKMMNRPDREEAE